MTTRKSSLRRLDRRGEKNSRRHAKPITNEHIAEELAQIADLLEAQGANPFRINAYRRGAVTMRELPQPATEIYCSAGTDGLCELPGIGQSLARTIEQLLCGGESVILRRLRGKDSAEYAFRTVADIGPELARRIHRQLEIETLAELEAAAHDGRLAQVTGMGPKRIRAVRESLTGRFATSRRTRSRRSATDLSTQVPVEELLDLDAEYRRLAQAGKLRKIARRRFNPTGAAWLPILHTHREDRHYTLLFSNTARAHELGVNKDWVVIYRDDEEDGQWTVITAGLGKLRGRRIVRGREEECAAYYQLS